MMFLFIMMLMRSQLQDYITQGQQGLNKALPIGINDPTEAFIGILPSHYYLIGADSGVGKTTFADFNFLLTPYFENKNDELVFNLYLNEQLIKYVSSIP